MKIKFLFFIVLFSFVFPQSSIQADGLISSVYYEVSPPIERGKKAIKKKKHKKKFKLKQKRKITKTKNLQKPGFIVMLLGGVLVAGFAIYIGSLIAAWSGIGGSGCLTAFVATTFTVLVWLGFILLTLIAIALITIGIIFTVYYNSPKYKGSPKKAKKEKKKAPKPGSHKLRGIE